MSDSQSIARSKLWDETQDKEKTFWQLWKQYRDYLCRCCHKWMNGNPTDADDVLSRAMLKAWEKFRDCKVGIKNFKAWLIKLTHNLCLDTHRERNRDIKRVESLDAFESEFEFVSQEENPVLSATRTEQKKFVRCAIDELPIRLRETFTLHFYQELSYQEIAQLQDISYQNVCKRISQARAMLREKLREYFLGEDATDSGLSVTPSLTTSESATGEKAKENAVVEPILDESLTLSEAAEEVEIVVTEKPQEAVNFSRDVENLSPPLPNPLLRGEGSGYIFLAQRAWNSPPTLLGNRSFSEKTGGLGLGLVFPHGVKSQLNNPINSS